MHFFFSKLQTQKKSILKTQLLACLGVFLAQCSSDDIDPRRIPVFSESAMSLIHNDSEKSWRITEVINIYFDPTDELEIELECVEDDIYTFLATQEDAIITLGDVYCFDDVADGIFTADRELFHSSLLMMNTDDGPTIYMSFARGYVNEDQTAIHTNSRYYALAELSEDRMVFYRGDGTRFIGEYRQALVFESVN